jgi:RNA polymerase sigma factor (sigma-70 family)
MAEPRRSFGNTTGIRNLLERINAGDRLAREELLQESKERLQRMASKLLDGFPRLRHYGHAETGDVISEVMLKLYQSFDAVEFLSPEQFINIAAQKIRYCLLDLARVLKREIDERGKAGVIDLGVSPDLATGWADKGSGGLTEDDWAEFHLAVEKLPEEEKRVFTLRHYGGWSREETAVILEISEKTVTRRYGRAVHMISTAIQINGN